MSDVTLLRNNAIVRNASVGTSPPHGPVKTGELPLVQVKMGPGGPQIQEGQQKPMQILPSKDPKGNVTTGALPMVQVKMTQNGPQPDDGQDRPVVIRDGKQQSVATGGLPMVQVKMENGRPKVQNMPNVQAGPVQIPSAPPALSSQRAAAPQSQGLPRSPHVQSAPPQMLSAPSAMGQPRVARIAAPQVALPALPEVPELTVEQWMLCRHRVDKYLKDLLVAERTFTNPPTELPPKSEALVLAEETIKTIDDLLVATAVRAEAAATAAAAPPSIFVSVAPVAPAAPAAFGGYVAPRPVTGGHFSPAALTPQSSVPQGGGYVAQRPAGARAYTAGAAGGRSQGNFSAPRRVQRTARPAQPAEPLPPVIVNMDGNRPVVQQQSSPSEASAAPAEAAGPVTAPEPAPDAPGGDAQG